MENVEQELKYITDDENAFSILLDLLVMKHFKIESDSNKTNYDSYYYDGDNSILNKHNSLRVRKTVSGNKTKYKGTYKQERNDDTIYASRNELEIPLDGEKYQDLVKAMNQENTNLDFNSIDSTPVIDLVNQRKDVVLIYRGEKVCLSYDRVKYINHRLNDIIAHDLMIEIEAVTPNCSEVLSYINLIIKDNIPKLIINRESKYQRGVTKTVNAFNDLTNNSYQFKI